MVLNIFFADPRNYILLNPEYLVLGITGVILEVIVFVILIKFLQAYRRYKDINFLYFFFAFLSISIAWLGVTVFFLIELIFNFVPPLSVYFLIQGGVLLWGGFMWSVGVTKLAIYGKKNEKKRKVIQILSGLILIPLNVVYIAIAIAVPDLLGASLLNIFEPSYSNLHRLYLVIGLIPLELFGMWLVINTINLSEQKDKLKGKILFLSLILIAIGAILETIFSDFAIKMFARLLVLISAVCFYWSFFLPKMFEHRL